ncbi:MAG: long-chain fatty acid--CoA ligase [Gammaproteobacteria bacterium]|nr:long-chain fatty acid--CoA ligase [Gammaproteobacteria bacterium]
MDLSDWIDQHACNNPDKSALIFNNTSISYKSLANQINDFTQILGTELSIKPGDRIAYLGLNSPDMIAIIFACARVGAIFLPLNWRLAGPEHCQLLGHATPVALFAEQSFINHIDNICDELTSITLVSFNEENDKWLSVNKLNENNSNKPAFTPPNSISEEDSIILCYTSGTTGIPKGALLSKKALATNALNSIDMHNFTAEDIVLTVLPMFHVGGLNIQTLPALFSGSTVVIHDRFDAEQFFDSFSRYPITLTLVVPTIMHVIMADPRWQSLKPKQLRMISIGSSVVPESLVKTVCDWGVPLVQVYGATETCPIAAYIPTNDAARKPASTGKTALHCEIKLVDENANQVADGDKGEILVKGDNVLLKYWNDEIATKEVFTQQWFHTGDVGHFDEEGFLFVDGRIKDMIICGGENLYPAAIENTLSQCPDIKEVTIVGKPDDYWGEICVAVIATESGNNFEMEQLQNYCLGKIARSSIPREIITVDELPRNAMGKVVKEALNELILIKTNP